MVGGSFCRNGADARRVFKEGSLLREGDRGRERVTRAEDTVRQEGELASHPCSNSREAGRGSIAQLPQRGGPRRHEAASGPPVENRTVPNRRRLYPCGAIKRSRAAARRRITHCHPLVRTLGVGPNPDYKSCVDDGGNRAQGGCRSGKAVCGETAGAGECNIKSVSRPPKRRVPHESPDVQGIKPSGPAGGSKVPSLQQNSR
jgi:hypothetical protein